MAAADSRCWDTGAQRPDGTLASALACRIGREGTGGRLSTRGHDAFELENALNIGARHMQRRVPSYSAHAPSRNLTPRSGRAASRTSTCCRCRASPE